MVWCINNNFCLSYLRVCKGSGVGELIDKEFDINSRGGQSKLMKVE